MWESLRLGIPLARFARKRDLHYEQLSRQRKNYLAGESGPISALRSPDLQWIPVKAEKRAPQIGRLRPVHPTGRLCCGFTLSRCLQCSLRARSNRKTRGS